jgi:RNA polymerase sigma factor (sigma-70 family)
MEELFPGDPMGKATGHLGTVLYYLRRSVVRPAIDQTDGQLLQRFTQSRDETAFEALMHRHAAMVLGVCRRVLSDAGLAEDAFQATFLILARKAQTIRNRQSVGTWLFGVAFRTAQKARADALRRRAFEKAPMHPPPPDPHTEAVWRELRLLLDAELDRLPEKYRAPLVLCYLEGKTNQEAARQLGWTKGTVSGRLARARDLLRQRLVRRGVDVSAGLLTVLLSQQVVEASVPLPLFQTTLGSASGFTAATAQAASLAQGVSQMMLWSQLKVLTVAALVFVGVGVSAVTLACQTAASHAEAEQERATVPVLVQRTDDGDQKEIKELRKENERLRKELQQMRDELLRMRQQAQDARDRAQAALRQALERERAAREAAQAAADRAVLRAKASPIQIKSGENLKKIALAFHEYLDENKTFPPAAIYGKDGKALLSWRVALLPYMGQRDLYRQFKLDEPWDSEHNLKLLGQMPAVYASPTTQGQTMTTYYQVFTGPATLFRDRRGMATWQIRDGMSNTILVAEAGATVPWTKPADLPYDAKKPLPKLGGILKEGFQFATADGGLHFAPAGRQVIIRQAITPDGDEVIDLQDLLKNR